MYVCIYIYIYISTLAPHRDVHFSPHRLRPATSAAPFSNSSKYSNNSNLIV